MTKRPRVFWLHIDSFDNRGGRVWAVQTGGRYLIAAEVDCRVPTQTVFRGKTQQPWAYLRGTGVVRKRGSTISITES